MWFGEPHPFPKRGSLPDWACRDKHGNKGDHVEHLFLLRMETPWIIYRRHLKDKYKVVWLRNWAPKHHSLWHNVGTWISHVAGVCNEKITLLNIPQIKATKNFKFTRFYCTDKCNHARGKSKTDDCKETLGKLSTILPTLKIRHRLPESTSIMLQQTIKTN